MSNNSPLWKVVYRVLGAPGKGAPVGEFGGIVVHHLKNADGRKAICASFNGRCGPHVVLNRDDCRALADTLTRDPWTAGGDS